LRREETNLIEIVRVDDAGARARILPAALGLASPRRHPPSELFGFTCMPRAREPELVWFRASALLGVAHPCMHAPLSLPSREEVSWYSAADAGPAGCREALCYVCHVVESKVLFEFGCHQLPLARFGCGGDLQNISTKKGQDAGRDDARKAMAAAILVCVALALPGALGLPGRVLDTALSESTRVTSLHSAAAALSPRRGGTRVHWPNQQAVLTHTHCTRPHCSVASPTSRDRS
jgi:hypothetical protein